MFKLGAFTDEISQDLAHAVGVCGEFGVEGLELRGVWDTPVHKLTDAQVKDIRAIVDDSGMKVCSIGSPFGKCELDNPAEIAEHYDYLRRCAEIGHALDCNVVRGFAFWGHGVRIKPWDAMLKAYEPVPNILEQGDIVLGLENEHACYVGTAGHARAFLDLLRCPRIKLTWDPANHVHDPDSDEELVFPDGYELVREHIVHVHVKDARVERDGERHCVFMGEGQCRWPEQLQALKDDGYSGYISLETHVNPEQFPEHLRERYGAWLTGEGREASSRVCLAWIRDAMAALK